MTKFLTFHGNTGESGVSDDRDGRILMAMNGTCQVRNRADVMVVSSFDVRMKRLEKIDDSQLL